MPIRLNGATSGYVELASPDVAGATVLELPTDSIKPGLVLVAATSFTTTAAVNVNNCFTSTYDNYRIVARIIGSAASIPYIRLRVGGVDANGANYSHQYWQASAATVSGARTTGATTHELGTIGLTDYMSVAVEVLSPARVATTQFAVAASSYSTVDISGFYSGRHSLLTSYDGFTIYPGTGTITGSLYVYGYRKEL